jgi:hypothetical protein
MKFYDIQLDTPFLNMREMKYKKCSKCISLEKTFIHVEITGFNTVTERNTTDFQNKF